MTPIHLQSSCITMMRWTVLPLALLASGQALEVTTTSGRVSGSQQTFEGTHSTGDYISFQGIPYARPPVGPLRFQEPQEVEAWSGTRNCSGGPPAMCPQVALAACLIVSFRWISST